MQSHNNIIMFTHFFLFSLNRLRRTTGFHRSYIFFYVHIWLSYRKGMCVCVFFFSLSFLLLLVFVLCIFSPCFLPFPLTLPRFFSQSLSCSRLSFPHSHQNILLDERPKQFWSTSKVRLNYMSNLKKNYLRDKKESSNQSILILCCVFNYIWISP